jgi:lipoprotein-anchoring transpeptidase ErfK/SrfK
VAGWRLGAVVAVVFAMVPTLTDAAATPPTRARTAAATPQPLATSVPTSTPQPPTATSQPTPTAIDPAAVNDASLRDVVRARAPRAAILRAQILFDHAHFSPGEIDAAYGANMRRAIAAFQRARGLPESGEVDAATWAALSTDTAPALVFYVLTPQDVAGPFTPIPPTMMEKATLETLPYASLLEELGEKFHLSPALLTELNPGRRIANAGDEITVPTIVYGALPQAGEVVVDESDRSLTVIDTAGAVFARYPATTGSHHDPLPIGIWRINGIGHYPTFHYNPRLFWDAGASDRSAPIAPGPNNPVGVVWLDLSKEHYGIHGTPEPSLIGRTQSHGCIRLTNWNAEELSQMVKYGTPVTLQP